MSLLHAYLIGYLLLAIAAAWTLWQSGILTRFPLPWVVIAALLVVAAGVLLFAASPTRSAPPRR